MVAGGRELIDTLWNVNIGFIRNGRSIPIRINRYIMECKFKTYASRVYRGCELIDTLWNVNCHLSVMSCMKKPRINRYIMECKYACLCHLLQTCVELIDTLWNVNMFGNKRHISTLRGN